MQSDELNSKYQRISEEEAQEGWEDVYDASFRACMHGPGCQQGPDCQVSLIACPRFHPYLILSHLSVWLCHTSKNRSKKIPCPPAGGSHCKEAPNVSV